MSHQLLLPSQKTRVLVVDDADEIRLAICEILSEHGYEVVEATSGAAALRALQHGTYDLMLLDLRMPSTDGVEVMKRLHASSLELPVIVVTAYPTVESAIVAVRTGARDYLLKPFAPEDLLTVVEKVATSRADEMRRQLLLDTISETVAMLQSTPQSGATTVPVPSPTAPHNNLNAPSSPESEAATLRAGRLCLHREKRQVFLCDEEGAPEELTEGEAAVLTLLMSTPDTVLSCRDLATRGLNYEVLDEYEAQSIVRPYIFRLRQKIEQDPQHSRLIRTVRGRGYFLALD